MREREYDMNFFFLSKTIFVWVLLLLLFTCEQLKEDYAKWILVHFFFVVVVVVGFLSIEK